MLLFSLDCVVPALEALKSSLPPVGCLSLLDRGDALGLAGGGCKSCAVCRGAGRARNVLLLSSDEAPVVVTSLDSS